MSSLKKNIVNLLVVQLFTFVIPILQFPYLTRILGVDNFSMYIYALSLFQLCNIATEYGLVLYLTQRIAGGETSKKFIGEILTSSSKIRVLVLILTMSIYYWVAYSFTNYGSHIYFIIISIGIFFEAFSLQWYFQATEKLYVFSRLTIFTRAVCVFLVFLLIKNGDDVNILAMLTILPSIITSLVSYVLINRDGVWFHRTSLVMDKRILVESFPFFLTKISVSFYTSLTTVILGAYGTKEQVAYYGVAARIYSAIQSVISVLNQALYPYMMRTKNFILLYRMLILTFVGSLTAIIFMHYIGGYVIYYFAGEKYLPAKKILDMFMIIALISTSGLLMGYPALAPLGKAKIANYSVIVAGIVQLVMLYVLIFFNLGINAKTIVATIGISEFIILMIRVFSFIRYRKIHVKV